MRYTGYYGSGKKHAYRNTLFSVVRNIVYPMRDLTLILLILKLCDVISIGYLPIVVLFAGYVIGNWVLDIVSIAADRAEERERMAEWEKDMRKWREERANEAEEGSDDEW